MEAARQPGARAATCAARAASARLPAAGTPHVSCRFRTALHRRACCLASMGRSKNVRMAACMRCSSAGSEPLRRQGWVVERERPVKPQGRRLPPKQGPAQVCLSGGSSNTDWPHPCWPHWLISWKKPHSQAAAATAAATSGGGGSVRPGANRPCASISGGPASPPLLLPFCAMSGSGAVRGRPKPEEGAAWRPLLWCNRMPEEGGGAIRANPGGCKRLHPPPRWHRRRTLALTLSPLQGCGYASIKLLTLPQTSHACHNAPPWAPVPLT